MLIVLQASEVLKHQSQPHAPMVVAVPQDPQFGPAMYATMRHQPQGGAALRIAAAQGELIPEFVPPPPPMFENGCGGIKPPAGVIKPPLPPGKPDKITVTVAKGKPLGAKGEKKRESTV